MLEIPLLNKFLSSVTSNRLDDVVDRLHSVVTVTILILFSMFVGAKQHFGQPIQCMIPAHMDRSSWAAYGQYFCFVESTYHLSYNRTVPNAQMRSQLKNQRGVRLNYYQWVPYFFALQAFCFYAPIWIWKMMQAYSYVDMHAVVEECLSIKIELKQEQRQKKLDRISEFVSSSIDYRQAVQSTRGRCLQFPPNKNSWYCTFVYLLCKLASLLNDIFQFYFICHFLGADSPLWAIKPLALTVGIDNYSFSSPYFPHVTFCDMEKYEVGSVQTHTLQCVVMLNMINEKLFILLWYWLIFLTLASFVSLFYTMIHLVSSGYRESTVRFYIQTNEDDEEFYLRSDKNRLSDFSHNILGMDGVLMLRFVSGQASAIVARDLAARLWRIFSSTYQERLMLNSFRMNMDSVKPLRMTASAPTPDGSPQYPVRQRYPTQVRSDNMYPDNEKLSMSQPHI